MSAWLIAFVGIIYAYIAGENLFKGEYNTAMIYAGYAFSNVGLYFISRS